MMFARQENDLSRSTWRLLIVVACAVALFLVGSAAKASAATVWNPETKWADTNLPPGGKGLVTVDLQNVGTTDSSGPITVTVDLPPHVTRVPPLPLDSNGALEYHRLRGEGDWSCSGTSTVTCTRSDVFNAIDEFAGHSGYLFPGNEDIYQIRLNVKIASGPEVPGTYTIKTTANGGGAPTPGIDVAPITISSTPAGFGIREDSFTADVFDAEFPNGSPLRQAGSHPYALRVNFDFNLKRYEFPSPTPALLSPARYAKPDEFAKGTEVTLPRGLIGNPEAVPKCDAKDFATLGVTFSFMVSATGCAPATQVGILAVRLTWGAGAGFGPGITSRVAVYNLIPPKGVPADFGFQVGPYTGHIYPILDPAHDYAIKALAPFISDLAQVDGAKFTMWGVPGDPGHDFQRAVPVALGGTAAHAFGIASEQSAVRPLLTLPSDCSGSGPFWMRTESWQHPGVWTPRIESGSELTATGCADPRFRFEPDVALQPGNRDAGAPTGLEVHLEVPQRDQAVHDAKSLYDASGSMHAIDTPPIKKVVVTLPEGMTISTSAAQGLGSCSAEQIGIGTDSPVTCPENSRYGSLTLHTPILPPDAPMVGDIYIAKQSDNPFHNFLAMYFVIHDEERGLLVKIPGRIDLDPKTGQITTTFDDLPQFPISDMQLNLKGGVRAALVNPATCGSKTIKAEFYPWQDPNTPVVRSSSYRVTNKPDGSACVSNLGERPFAPQMTAGTVNPNAGSYSPFIFRLTRTDDDQEFSQLGAKLPPGLIAKIAGVDKCSNAAIEGAEAPGRAGITEQLFPSCPASSQIGTTDVGSGVGQVVTYIPGRVYLAGPYKGAPLSMVVITPILAGPYDLGVIAVRSAIDFDSGNAQVSVRTDPFPQIFKGIPVRLRDIRVKVDRPETILNPTNCDPMSVDSHVTGTGGDVNTTADDTAADLSDRFQAANCAALGFKPRISISLRGGTSRSAHPALHAVLRARPGDANIADTTVTLPRSAFLEQAHIRTVCTRVQFAAKACPDRSIYGHAEASTPLLDEPLRGPVYLRSSNHKLPDMVISLGGVIDVDVVSRVDAVHGRIRSRFESVPDAPVSRFVLDMQGAKKGLIVNSRNLCAGVSRAQVLMTGQNGKPNDFNPVVRPTGCKTMKNGKDGRGR